MSAPDALRALLTGTRGKKTPQERADDCPSCSRVRPPPEPATGSAGSPTSDQSGSLPSAARGQLNARESAPPPVAPDACAAQLAGKRPVTFVGTGTYRGAPVTVIGLTERGRVIAFLVPSNDCTNVLRSVSR
jgi:hypothetical protein